MGKKNIPIVLIECEAKGAHSVRVNNIRGAYEATEYLIKKGRKKIGLIVGIINPDSRYEKNMVAEERLLGYKKALKDNGIEFDEKKSRDCGIL